MRETGPVRRQLSGDEAVPYQGHARTILGQLKNDMAFNELPQGVRTRYLPDGAVIRVESRYGQDTISITVPVPPEKEALVETTEVPIAVEVPIEIPEPILDDVYLAALRIVGTTASTPFSGAIATVWNGLGQVVDIIPGLPGTTGETVTDISDNALVVVGYSSYASGFEPWRWTRAGGTQSLGALGGLGRSRAYAVSAEGAIVVGAAEGFGGGSATRAWVWRADTGALLLPSPGYESAAYAISPNGKYIAGTLSQMTVNGPEADGAVWTDSVGPTIIPRPGTTTDVLDPAPPFDQRNDTSVPVDVTDSGVVVGDTGHFYTTSSAFSNLSTFSPTHLGFGGGTSLSAGTTYRYDETRPAVSFSYDVVSSEYRVIEAGSVRASASKRPDLVVGLVQHSTLQPQHVRVLTGWFTGDPLDYSSYLDQVMYANQTIDQNSFSYVSDYSSGFKMNRGVQTRFEDQTLANDVTEDGAIAVGRITDGALSYLPCMWIGTRRVDLQLPEGAHQGEATAVANPKFTLYADGQVSPTSAV